MSSLLFLWPGMMLALGIRFTVSVSMQDSNRSGHHKARKPFPKNRLEIPSRRNTDSAVSTGNEPLANIWQVTGAWLRSTPIRWIIRGAISCGWSRPRRHSTGVVDNRSSLITHGTDAVKTHPFSSSITRLAFGIAVATARTERGGSRYRCPDELRSKPAREVGKAKGASEKLPSYALRGYASHRCKLEFLSR